MKSASVWIIAFVLILILSSCIPSNLAPILLKVSGLEGVIQISTNFLEWIGTDTDGNIARYEYRKDGGSWQNHGSNTSYVWEDYSESSHTFEARAIDDKGSISNVLMWSFVYDPPNIIPEVIKEGGFEGKITNWTNAFSWSASDVDGHIVKCERCKDGGSWAVVFGN